jgi:hypothetical protein
MYGGCSMSNIELCSSVEELKKFSMQELSSLYSKMTKTHCPKFSDKTVAAKRILPMLEQKRTESKLIFVDPPKDLSKIIKVRGRPKGQLSSRLYHFNFDKFYDRERDFAPQARQIIRALAAKNISTFTEVELIPLIDVKTKQDPWRIFQYYRPQLVSRGVLRLENA